MMPSIYFIGNKNNASVERAKNFTKQLFPESDLLLTNKKNIIPENLEWWRGDYIVSFLSPLILPEYVLECAEIAAINFHPALPDYPGTQSAGRILLNKESNSGITCHHMTEAVDSGSIIRVRQFTVYPTDTLSSLIDRREAYALVMFFDVMGLIAEGLPLPESDYTWIHKKEVRCLGKST